MNRIYLLGADGRVWFGERNSTSFELLDLDDSQMNNACQTRIKRLSSCEWCLWMITSRFQVSLYVFKLDTPFENQVISFENQVCFFSS